VTKSDNKNDNKHGKTKQPTATHQGLMTLRLVQQCWACISCPQLLQDLARQNLIKTMFEGLLDVFSTQCCHAERTKRVRVTPILPKKLIFSICKIFSICETVSTNIEKRKLIISMLTVVSRIPKLQGTRKHRFLMRGDVQFQIMSFICQDAMHPNIEIWPFPIEFWCFDASHLDKQTTQFEIACHHASRIYVVV
jgi:hypothetical protein